MTTTSRILASSDENYTHAEDNCESTRLLDGSTSVQYTGPDVAAGGAPPLVYKRRWYILFLFSGICFWQGAIWNTWAPIAGSVEAAMAWTDSDIALQTNWGTITFVMTAFFLAWLMDVKGLRWAVVLVSVLASLGAGLRCITSDPKVATWLINMGQILNGFAGPVAMGMPPLLSAVWFPVHQRTTSTAISTATAGLGVATSFIIGPLVVPEISNTTVLPHNMSSLGAFQADTTAAQNIAEVRQGIMRLMYIEFGCVAALTLAILIYFPPRPPTPPSITASIDRMDFGIGLKLLVRHKGLWVLGGVYALCNGIYYVWSAVINVNLKHLHIDEETAGYIGFSGTIAGNITAIIISIFADIFTRRLKTFLVIQYSAASVMFMLFALEVAGYIPFHISILYSTMIGGSMCVSGGVPLLYELVCEATYPVAEGLTNTTVTMMSNATGLIFLLILMIPMNSYLWMNWTVLLCTALCVPVLILYRERYNRMDIDDIVINVNPDNTD